MKKQLIGVAVFLIVIAAAMRILRDAGVINLPPNVAPIAALAMFGGAYLPRRLAFVIPLAAMILSDFIIGWYEPQIVAAVYVSFAVSGLLGMWLRSRRTLPRVVGATVAGSLLFFLATNAAVWAFDSHGLYPHTMSGLAAAYAAGLPFLKFTLFGDLAFVGAMFGTYELASLWLRQRVTASSTI